MPNRKIKNLCEKRKGNMPVTVERLDDQPIILATFTGEIDVEMVKTMFQRSAEIQTEIGTPVYRITDVRAIETSLMNLLSIVREASQDVPGSPLDPHITGMFVGTNKWVRLFQSALDEEEYGSISIPAFVSMEDALAHIDRLRSQDAP
jgi:hypothetical protein